jgi:hypothetical protein
MSDRLAVDLGDGVLVAAQLQVLSHVVEKEIDGGLGRVERIERPIEHDVGCCKFWERRRKRRVLQDCLQALAEIADHVCSSWPDSCLNDNWPGQSAQRPFTSF